MTGDMYSELCTLCNLGNCLRAKGSLNQALEYYQMVRIHHHFRYFHVKLKSLSFFVVRIWRWLKVWETTRWNNSCKTTSG